jgi:BirA family transcriptional regulator, biotin operon repressor / biotin---[acetyl-CoA-carboxylase] ligase
LEFRIIRHETVDSTSERAFDALAEGTARHGDVHLAGGQSRGRGRRGASWSSPDGEGLYLSAVLLPGPPPLHPASLTMAAGLAVRDATVELGLRGALLKWPNDVLVRGAKLAGILVETRGLDASRPHYVVGIGVNVLQREFPRELLAEREVTSLALEGLAASVDRTREAVLRALSARLETIRADPERVASEFLGATGLLGRRVRVAVAAEETVGVLRELTLAEGLALDSGGRSLARFPIEHVRKLDAIG